MNVINFDIKGKGFQDRLDVKIYLESSTSILVNEQDNVLSGSTVSYNPTVPGVYKIRVLDNIQCVQEAFVEVFFPVTTHVMTDVDCTDNTYSVIFNLLNTQQAGENIQYGWAVANSVGSVVNWQSTPTLRVPADESLRYFFIRNSTCAFYKFSTSKTACSECSITISNIIYSCDNAS